VPNPSAKDLHVAFLVNFVAPNHWAVFREVQRRIGRLSLLASVAMESNREFESKSHEDLNVIIQKTRTITRTARHPSGYEDINYIHIPLDTLGQLRRLKPDVIVSLEMGARTISSLGYRFLNRRCAVVAAVCASQRSEEGRGLVRRSTRKLLLRNVDWVTFNGPSCQRYLLSLGASAERMSAWDYAADPAKIYYGSIPRMLDPTRIRLLTVGQLSKRKGVMEAMEQLSQWAVVNSSKQIEWNLLGNGPLESGMREFAVPKNLTVKFHGHCGVDVIREHYRDNDFLLFPTLGDEWGLVVDEALHSGLPVIGSTHSQAVATVVRDGLNGWCYDPEDSTALPAVLTEARDQAEKSRLEMIRNSRESAALRTPLTSAMQFLNAVESAANLRRR
jgi:glycosyltransferase involved in cell wall biosynthesis